MIIQSLLPGVLGEYTEEHITGYIFRMWARGRNGRIIRPIRAKALRIPVSTLYCRAAD